jgi:hypothetical protein
MGRDFCGDKHLDGWLCILRPHEKGDHMSLDNKQLWKGTPGMPIRWVRKEVAEKLAAEYGGGRAPGSDPRSLSFDQARQLNYTGDPCPSCQALTLKRNGACLLCTSCGDQSSCS